MRVDVPAMPQTPVETRFVVGGVYRLRPDRYHDEYRILIEAQFGDGKRFAWLDPQSGEVVWTNWKTKVVMCDSIAESFVYDPDARLVPSI